MRRPPVTVESERPSICEGALEVGGGRKEDATRTAEPLQLGLGNTAGSAMNVGDAAGEMIALGDIVLPEGGVALAVTAGQGHTCVILANRSAFCWGSNVVGQLGQNDTSSVGSSGGQAAMLALSPVNIGAGLVVADITAGGAHTCVVLEQGGQRCWGLNSYGQLGVESNTTYGTGTPPMSALPAVVLPGRRSIGGKVAIMS